jgi:hypothetical protein
MALGNDGIRPDALELRIRFLCGALFGAFVAGAAVFESGVFSGVALATSAVSGALVGGVLARHYGDAFWRSLRRGGWWPF